MHFAALVNAHFNTEPNTGTRRDGARESKKPKTGFFGARAQPVPEALASQHEARVLFSMPDRRPSPPFAKITYSAPVVFGEIRVSRVSLANTSSAMRFVVSDPDCGLHIRGAGRGFAGCTSVAVSLSTSL